MGRKSFKLDRFNLVVENAILVMLLDVHLVHIEDFQRFNQAIKSNLTWGESSIIYQYNNFLSITCTGNNYIRWRGLKRQLLQAKMGK